MVVCCSCEVSAYTPERSKHRLRSHLAFMAAQVQSYGGSTTYSLDHSGDKGSSLICGSNSSNVHARSGDGSSNKCGTSEASTAGFPASKLSSEMKGIPQASTPAASLSVVESVPNPNTMQVQHARGKACENMFFTGDDR